MKRSKIIILIICIILINAKPVKAIVSIEGNTNSFGGDNPCQPKVNGDYVACYEPKYEFRITLVDWEGKKVAGTKSVEYGYSTDKKTKIVTYTATQKSNFINGDKFAYKYSSEYKDYNPISDHIYYQINMMDNPTRYQNKLTGKDDPLNYAQFVHTFTDSIKNKDKRYGIENGTTGEYDFISMFLYHCGFLDKNQTDGRYYNIDDSTNQIVKNAATTIAHPDKDNPDAKHYYYLLIEPLYTIFYTDTKWQQHSTYKYGTATEMGNFLFSKGDSDINKLRDGYLKGLSLIYTYNIGSNLYTQAGEQPDFRTSEPLQHIDIADLTRYNVIAPPAGSNLNDRAFRRFKWQEVSNLNYGYGVEVLKVSNLVEKPIEESILNPYILNRCNNARKEKNSSDGIVQFSSQRITKNEDFFKNEQNKFTKNTANGNTLYCYDDFKYDFSSILTQLNRPLDNPFEPNTEVTIPKGTLTITRYCYIEKPDTISNQTKEFAQDFSMYYRSKYINVKIFNDTLKMEPDTSSINVGEKWIVTPITNRITHTTTSGIIAYETTIDFVYKSNNSKYIIPSNVEKFKEYTASVDLSNVSYGYSANLIEQLEKGNIEYQVTKINGESKEIQSTYILELQNEYGNTNVCEFVTSVKDGSMDNIKYRTIALDNPFPARDAGARMPGSNWIGNNNYVRGYITYNRGVTGDAVYDKDPLYKIELTPSTMIKIREYNRTHNYGDIKLNCTGANNTECFSEFLRKTSILKSSSITGACMIESTSNTYRDIKNGVTQAQLNQKLANMTDEFRQTSSYDSRFDFNHDKRINRTDALIFIYAEKTTPYYTCADKTYENSGYLERDDN